MKEKDLQYYEDLEKKEEEKIQKRNERKQKREEKRNVSIIKLSITVCVDSTIVLGQDEGNIKGSSRCL